MKTIFKTICVAMVCAVALIVTPQANAQESKKGNATQQREKSQDEIKSQKIAFLTKELSLTPEEAEKFWPVYNKADKALNEARRATRKAVFTLKKAIADEAKADGEINALSAQVFGCIDKENEAAKEAYNEYLKVLPTRKAAKVRLAEESFMHSLIHKLRKSPEKPQKAKR